MQSNPQQQEQNTPVEPYVGPTSFQRDQRQFFFGRDEEADELVSMITAHSAVLLYSQSGAGKSSLLNAKLIPKLEEEEDFNVLPTMRVQGQIPPSVKIGRTTNIFVTNALLSCGGYDLTRANHGSTFTEFLKNCIQRTNEYGEPCPTVLVFDQFEELFTSYPGRWPDREDFFRQIGEAIEGNPKKGLPGNPLLRVLFSMREDYIAELDPYLHLLPEKLRSRFRLEHLREKKALVAIKEPLAKTNRSFAPGVAEQLVKNLLRIPSQSVTGTQTLGLYIEPVQLQVVCQSLWAALGPNETVITAKHLQKYGDVSQALSHFYERSIATVAKETEIKEEILRRWFADTLITSEGTRAPVNRGNETTGGMPNAAVDKLEAMRLIKGEWKGTNVRWYELAHDRFIEPIKRSNDAWLANQSRGEQIRLRLEAKAAKWKPGTKVLDADELFEARNLVSANAASPSLRALVDASRVGATKKRIKVLTFVALVAGVALLIFMAVAYYAFTQRNFAKARFLALKGSMVLASDPELSVLLAREAIDEYADTGEARNVIRSALLSLSNVGAAFQNGEKAVGAEFSPDGKFVLTRTIDGRMGLWEVAGKKKLKELQSYEGGSFSTFSPDGKFFVSTGGDGVVRLWDVASVAQVREFRGHANLVNRAIFTPDGKQLITASEDQSVRIWDVASGAQTKVLTGHEGGVQEITFSSDQVTFATEAADGMGMIWSLNSDKGTRLEGLTGSKAALAFSPDGQFLVTEGAPGTEAGELPEGGYPATVWDVKTGKLRFTLTGHENFISAVGFSPDGNAIVTSSADSTARLWTSDGNLVKELTGHTGPLSGAFFSPDGKFLVTISADNSARVWDALDGRLITRLNGHAQAINSAAFSSDGQFIVTASDDQTTRVWPFRPGSGSLVESWEHSAAVTSIACNPSGSEVAATTRDGKLWLEGVGMQRSLPFQYLIDRTLPVGSVKFSPDGQFIATSKGHEGVVYNIEQLRHFMDSARSVFLYPEAPVSEQERKEALQEPHGVRLQGHGADVKSVAFSSDGTLIATASADGTARIWNATTGQNLGELRGHDGTLNSAVFSPDGKFIVTAGDDRTVRLWDAKSFAFVRMIGGTHPASVSNAVYSPDGRFIVTASAEVAWVCDAFTGQVRKRLEGHTGQVNSASFSPDSRLVVTASADNTARVWSTEGGESIAVLMDHKGPVLNALFSPNGQWVFTASEDYATRIYPREAFAPFEELRGLIKQRVARELTPQERRDYLKDPEIF